MSRFEIEKQFKKDFNMTLDQAIRIHNKSKSMSDELFALKLALNGVDIVTGGKAVLSDEDKSIVKARINELENKY